jgi:hypothetical protein
MLVGVSLSLVQLGSSSARRDQDRDRGDVVVATSRTAMAGSQARPSSPSHAAVA